MKINSAFSKKCRGCFRPLPKATFSAGSDFDWPCRGCSEPICASCYVGHTDACCPDMGVMLAPHPSPPF